MSKASKIAPPVPAGYESLRSGSTHAVARHDVAAAIRQALRAGTLFEYAQTHATARPLEGRGIAYAVSLPAHGGDAVVRHSRHGGMLARYTGDRFLTPTRAPHELAVALRLRDAGVRTAELLAYATYPAGPLLRRSDVVTRFLAHATDLAEVLRTSPDGEIPSAVRAAVQELVETLAAAGARHRDLNLKNVLIVPGTNEKPRAYVIDVDRVLFGRPSDPRARAANLTSLAHSEDKWRRLLGLPAGPPALGQPFAAAGARGR